MNTPNDYLWDPTATPDAEIEKFERALRPVSARALQLDLRTPIIRKRPRRKAWRYVGAIAAAASLAAITVASLYFHRLSWDEKAPWPVTIASTDGNREDFLLRVGERIVTTSEQSATLSVARIGHVNVAPNSEATLIRTEGNRHRLELQHGRLHAKIWAPPNYFGVNHGNASFIDMGCEFDLQIDSPERGTLTVQSGWVFYSVGYEEILVPDGYLLSFSEVRARIPVRTTATKEFREWVDELDRDAEQPSRLAATIAEAASDEDYYTLYMLMRRHPTLALSPLYPRLAAALKLVPSESHRERWSRGERDAINLWWKEWPHPQPKKWWVNWRDAF